VALSLKKLMLRLPCLVMVVASLVLVQDGILFSPDVVVLLWELIFLEPTLNNTSMWS